MTVARVSAHPHTGIPPGLPHIPAQKKYSGWATVVHTFDPILAAPVQLPSVAERVRAILADIDWSQEDILIWVPGTSEHDVPPKAMAELEKQFPGDRVHAILYQASWRFRDSIPDGDAVLRGVLEGIRAHGGRHRVLIGGESQGAWLICNAMNDPRLAQVITRAALWGTPAAAPVRFRDGENPNAKVREVDNPTDIVTVDLGGGTPKLIDAIDRLARHDALGGLLPLLGYGLTHPKVLATLVGGQLWRIPGVGSKHPSPHGYDVDLPAGIAFLRTGRRA
jgi:hypothetical protein